MFTTADLPAAMRADDVDAALLRAVARSGLRLDQVRCEHGRYDCPTCVVEAARRLVEAAAQGDKVA
jgi:uncharacterized protein (UPF0212 family)